MPAIFDEATLQAACARMLSAIERDGFGISFAADMNAARRSRSESALAKLTGIKAGEPDLRIYVEGGETYLVELKRLTGGRVGKDQKARHERLTELGFDVFVLWADTPTQATLVLAEHMSFWKMAPISKSDLNNYAVKAANEILAAVKAKPEDEI